MNESFYEEELGNLMDTVENEVHYIQRYADMFIKTIPNYKLVSIAQMPDNSITKFVLCEVDDMVLNIMLRFSCNLTRIAEKKRDHIKSSIKRETKDETVYKHNKKLFDMYARYIVAIDWKFVYTQGRQEDNIQTEPLYEFKKYLKFEDDYCKKQKELHKDFSCEIVSREDIESRLESLFNIVMKVLIPLKTEMEKTTSVYLGALICRQYIRVLVALYYALDTIEIK